MVAAEACPVEVWADEAEVWEAEVQWEAAWEAAEVWVDLWAT